MINFLIVPAALLFSMLVNTTIKKWVYEYIIEPELDQMEEGDESSSLFFTTLGVVLLNNLIPLTIGVAIGLLSTYGVTAVIQPGGSMRDQEVIDAMPDGSSHPFFFRNSSDYSFENVSESWGTANMKGYYTGSAYADLDGDGDLDLVVANQGQAPLLLKNLSSGANWLVVRARGKQSNRFGIGAQQTFNLREAAARIAGQPPAIGHEAHQIDRLLPIEPVPHRVDDGRHPPVERRRQLPRGGQLGTNTRRDIRLLRVKRQERGESQARAGQEQGKSTAHVSPLSNLTHCN